ncbi:hypothetical protein MLD38_037890 [Melastoma candidum]|uniref:Uncharacterized protein n=1 Tax=Melastoma candidum TaxID=119954 RepID=A0ACB9KXA3_9MYRT|nr:hypothetical protein MLD38_037890 [Melastoma candidum]
MEEGQWKAQMELWKEESIRFFHQSLHYARQIPPEQLYVAIASLFVASLFFLLSIGIFCRKKSNTVLLTGLSGGGKTVLFYQLRDGSSHLGTVTSMEPNEGTFVLHSEATKKGKVKPVHVVDVPGHSRLRAKLDEFYPQAAGIIFVVDAMDFLPNCRSASEYLYDILTNAIVVKKKIPVQILCNKTDKVTAHTKEFIRKQLEKEISNMLNAFGFHIQVSLVILNVARLFAHSLNNSDKLRASRSAVSAADIANDFTLGVEGEAFVFSQCPNKFTVAEAAGLTGEITQVEEFIRECVKP